MSDKKRYMHCPNCPKFMVENDDFKLSGGPDVYEVLWECPHCGAIGKDYLRGEDE